MRRMLAARFAVFLQLDTGARVVLVLLRYVVLVFALGALQVNIYTHVKPLHKSKFNFRTFKIKCQLYFTTLISSSNTLIKLNLSK